MSTFLVVEDEEAIRTVFKEIIENAFPDSTVMVAEDGKKALSIFKTNQINLVLTDIKMPKMDGVELLQEIKNIDPSVAVIVTSGHGDIDVAVECIKIGAFDYIAKPPDLNRLLTTFKNALESNQLKKENTTLRKTINKKYEIVGKSSKVKKMLDLMGKVAPTDARVFVQGENGVGKELVARNIHLMSDKSKFPFIEVNCAAIPSELIESELFGHEKGSFTGAHKQKIGKFELASEGTLFLDEIGDMSLDTQAKVLRALQENEITRVGGEKSIKVSPRIISATNKDLNELMKKGQFREDLYHRLTVIIVKVPSLNERRSDIPLLIKTFSNAFVKEKSMLKKEFSKDALELLKEINWTGNIRELRNVVERLLILGGDEISVEDVKTFVVK